MKKVLITGANGMIGSALVNELIDKYELVLLDKYTNRIEQYSDKALIIKESLSDMEKWQDSLEDVYCVVHLAAAVHWVPKTVEEEKQFIKTNAEGTKDLFEICSGKGVDKFLFLSTNDVYEASNELITEETETNPTSVYGKSKLLGEKYITENNADVNPSVCIFRPASVYGVNDKGSMKSLIAFCRKGLVPMIGDGLNKKALLYLKDLIQAVEKYIESDDIKSGEVFNISSGDFGYKEMIDNISDVFGYKPFRLYIPGWFCMNIASKIGPLKKLAVAGETKMVSNDKANRLLGYEIGYRLVDGLRDSREYYY
ncbi:Nucleoside-diphosphate-sugar epimerase [Dethiosulfatibacter aminovorans DSM 17477]|uniref:Nucleoside-diphosphate-sugar epimerase n=1 Tax=Dethiosulfatibacter aminovorans DSM 17477 TaxID=1121476 RepID=A0A1M6IKR4_9FIRM|nr:NAD(P)-dependent oxidoreductase [Dethiosulfatibacter aminovorans]SHJ34977.1 Nucleoside-diphosphate-sugar epimerase [Dethiosulfatibacter aminovorans DSM 17477]